MIIKLINDSQPGITYEHYYTNVPEDIAKGITMLLDGYLSYEADFIIREYKEIEKSSSRGGNKY